MFANRGLLQRYQMEDDAEFIGRTDFDLNPGSMAEAYVNDDELLIRGKVKIVEPIELWWDRQGMPDWFLVTKLPRPDGRGKIQGVMGVLRRPDATERQIPVFQTVARAVEIIRRDFARPLLIGGGALLRAIAAATAAAVSVGIRDRATGISAQDAGDRRSASAGGDELEC